MKPIIWVENLSKQYRLGGGQATHSTLRESIVEAIRNPFKNLRRSQNQEDNSFWALKNINFEVLPGEVA